MLVALRSLAVCHCSKDLATVAERQIAGDQQAAAFVAVGEDLEQRKRYTLSAAAYNLGLILRKLLAWGKPREFAAQMGALLCAAEQARPDAHERRAGGIASVPEDSARSKSS